MNIWPLLISVLAILISAMSYYRSHHHVSRKLFAFNSITTSVFDNYEIPIILLNGGSSNVVLLGYSLSIKMDSGGSFSREDDTVNFEKDFNGLLKPGDASTITTRLNPKYEKRVLNNCSKPDEHNEFTLEYQLSLDWCDSNGKRYSSEFPVASITVENWGELCGIGEPGKYEHNLYKAAK